MSFSSFCPQCGSIDKRKYGRQNDMQRYQCTECGKCYTETTNTIFHSCKLSKIKLHQLISLIIDDTKLVAMMHVLKISSRTTYFWRMKIYKVVGKLVENMKLSGKVWIDELLIPVNKRMLVTKENGKKYAGLSRNQIVVACAIDESGNRYAEIAGRGHISSKQCIDTYGNHIEAGAHIIHDGIFSHDQLINHLLATEETHKSTVKSSKKAMQRINSFCAEISRNLIIHIGLRTENLQDYLNWIMFRSTLTSDNIKDKIEELEESCFQSGIGYRRKDRY